MPRCDGQPAEGRGSDHSGAMQRRSKPKMADRQRSDNWPRQQVPRFARRQHRGPYPTHPGDLQLFAESAVECPMRILVALVASASLAALDMELTACSSGNLLVSDGSNECVLVPWHGYPIDGTQ